MSHRIPPLFLCLTAACTLLLAGCGAAPGAEVAVQSGDASGLVKLSNTHGGTSPSLLKRADGTWAVAFVGSNTGDKKVYWGSSKDGSHWGALQALDSHSYSDQDPCLVEDASGTLNLYFASNRDGNDWQLYHAHYDGAKWSAPQVVDGFSGVESLSVACRDGRTLVAAERRGEGLYVSASADGDHFDGSEKVADSGFDPALTLLPDGTALVAYTRSNNVYFRASKPNADWAAEQTAASGADRVHEPALAWGKDAGELVYCERTADGYKLRERRFDTALKFTDGPGLPTFDGEARTPALNVDHNGKIGLAWGMKSTSGQQGIALTVLGDL